MIPVNEPLVAPNAKKYVMDCLDTAWVSSAGKYISQFEESFADYLGVKYATTVTNGTAALHLAIASLGIGPDDEIILPDLTIISCALAVIYQGAKPVFVDVDPVYGNIDPDKIENKITRKTRAIMTVHLFGHPAPMDRIMAIAKKHKLLVIEDCAQAHGAEIKIKDNWKIVGGIGDVGCFSFYGNKIVTTGEGGMVVTNKEKIYMQAKRLKDLAHDSKRRFLHNEIGFNYRMTNLQAALGLAQLEEIDKYIKKKKWMAEKYNKGLKNINWLELPGEEDWAKSVYWMYAIKVKKDAPFTRDKLCRKLRDKGVDTRDFFIPLSKQPVLVKMDLGKIDNPVALNLSQRGFYLPSGLAITEGQIERVIKMINKI